MLTSAAEQELADAVADLERTSLSRRVIREMSRINSVTAAELAKRLGVAEETVTTMLEDLAAKRLLEKKNRKGSEVLFSLTTIGYQALAVVDRRSQITE